MTDHADDPRSLDRVKGEISFFMEKTFQISFGYLGALVALVAASGLDVVSAAAEALGTTTAPLLCSGVLVLNAVYLALASGTLFATLKRGLYLMIHDPGGAHFRWERFVRESHRSPFGTGRLGSVAWNLDNYYMVPLFGLIVVVSIASAFVGLHESARAVDAAIVLLAAAGHAIPLAMVLATAKIASLAATEASAPER